MDLSPQMNMNCSRISAVSLHRTNCVMMQWNCRSVISKKHEIIYLVNKFKPSIIALAETWLKPGSVFKISGYSCYRKDRGDGYGGVAILIKNNLFQKPIPVPHHDDYTASAVSVNGICHVSLYIPRPSSDILNHFNSMLSLLPKPFIILGDFNIQHQSWGSSISSGYGEDLIDIIDRHNLCILNTGAATRRTNPVENVSAIDLTICTPDLAANFSWSTLLSTFGSDHFPIIISSLRKTSQKTIQQPRLKYKINDKHWDKFKSCVEDKYINLPAITSNNSNDCSEALANAILSAADEIFSQKNSASGKIPSPPWWDSECTSVANKRKLAEIVYNDDMTKENFKTLIETIEISKKLFRDKKFLSWRNFCESISPNSHPSIVWNNIRRFKSGMSNTNRCILPRSLRDSYLDKLAPPYVAPSLQSLMSPTPPHTQNLNSAFSIMELQGVLSNLRDSAPGEDGIPYSFLRNLGDQSLVYYLNLINSVMMSSNIPNAWKSQIILPILKPDKSPTLIASYRPIALSSVMAKIAEHLIRNRLEWFIESHSILSESQYGFRKGRSTLDSLSVFVTDIRLAFSRKESVVATFLDVNSAYDSVILPILNTKLQSVNVPSTLSNFILNMLYGRSVKLDNYDEIRYVWKGLPQGSVISPLLYNIYTYDLDSNIDSPVKVLQYADDLLIYCADSSIDKASCLISSALNNLKLWMDKNGLELSALKSNVVVFSRQRNPLHPAISYNGNLIPVRNETKFLGIVLDSKLTFLPHCEYLSIRCERLLNLLRCLSGVWWGAHPSSLRLVYNALIRSVIDYGSFLLEPCSAAGLKKLDAIQAKALRVISGAMKSSPINALQVECGEPPLQLRRQYLSDTFIYRSLRLSEHPLFFKLQLLSDVIVSGAEYWTHKSRPCLVNSWTNFNDLKAPTHSINKLPIYLVNYECLIISPNIHYNIGIDKFDPNVNSHFNFVVNGSWDGWHQIYTDASKHSPSDCVGVGVYHPQFKIVQKVKFPPETSVFTAECFGIMKALEYIILMKLPKTIIFCDSLSALQSLSKHPFKKQVYIPIIIQSRYKLYQCTQMGLTVSFAWIPSHCGIKGNEIADRLANEAVLCGDIFPFTNYYHDLISLAKISLQEAWNRAWSESTQQKGKYYYNIQKVILNKPWFTILKLSKRATSTLIRMRLGHVCSPAHLARLKIVSSPCCECGELIADLNHIILSCPLFDSDALYETLINLKIPFPTNTNCLLTDFRPNVYKALAEYIVMNNIKL